MSLRVLFVSGREVSYMRNRVLLAALRMHFDVTVLTPDIPSTPGRVLAGLVRFLVRRPEYDVCLAGFYGQPIALALSLFQRRPIILDAYVSTFDTLCEDRGRLRPHSIGGRLARWLDQRSCHLATCVLTDTQAHAEYFAETFGVSEAKLAPVYVGCDETIFFPRDVVSAGHQPIEVFYYGAFLPLHGTEIIVQAASRLRNRPDIHFTIGGEGMRLGAVQRMVTERALPNLDLVGWIPLETLPDYIARAHICLGGHFSDVPKAARVISTKTFQFMAMGKPTIVGDNPATQEISAHGKQVCAVPMGDPEALADAIRTLADDPAMRQQIAAGGYQVFRERLTTRAIADQLATIIQEVSCASVS
jgi:glycosyltransferase involved in cell wall biosynthesis